MGGLQGWQIVIIAAVILLLFGARKLPDLARGLGSSLRIFRAETKGMMEDGENKSSDTSAQSEQPRAVESSSDTSAGSASDPANESVADQAGQTKRDS